MSAEGAGAATDSRGGSGMWKYYALLLAAVALVLAYTYVADPCNRLLRTDFARMHPDFEILDSGAEQGSPESVRCQISYRKPGSPDVYREVWVYQYQGTAWEFSRVALPPGRATAGRSDDTASSRALQ